MALKNFDDVYRNSAPLCASILASDDAYIPTREFREAYALSMAKTHLEGYASVSWSSTGNAEVVTTANKRVMIPSAAFYLAKALVPVYDAISEYRNLLEKAIVSAGYSLDVVFASESELKKKNKHKVKIEFNDFVNSSVVIPAEEKENILRYLKNDGWWNEGKSPHRSDYYISPLLAVAKLQGATQSFVAVLTRQLAENRTLLTMLPELHFDYEEEFKRWYLECKCHGPNRTDSNSTIRHYSTGLKAVSAPQGEKDTQKWCGIYEYLTGTIPKAIFTIGSSKEFETVYGLFSEIFKSSTSKYFDKSKFDECHKYVKGPHDAPYLTDHGNLSAAFSAYKDFLSWRESKASNSINASSLLEVALTLFKDRRGDPDWAYPPDKPDWGYVSVNKGTREYYDELKKNIDALDVEKLTEMFTGVKDGNGHVKFWPMWSGSLGTGWDSIKKGLEREPQKTIKWIQDYAKSPADVLVFATKADDENRPMGFGKSVESELLMKFHPDAAIKCGSKTIEVLENFHLMTFKRKGTYDEWEYQQVLGIAADIKLRMDKLGITRTLEDKQKADYITVNEFVAWCHDNKDLIDKELKEVKRMNDEKMMKEIGEPLTTRTSDGLTFTAGNGNDLLMLRLMAALRAKPFVILAGHSGTGKSRLVRKLAYMTCNVDKLLDEKKGPQNFKMIQVKPNWHDSSDLLGYRSAIKDNKYIGSELVKFIFRAYTYPQTPFFLCLDEMNLAPVEQYFAEFLSAMESMKPANKDDTEGKGDFVSDPVIDLNVSDDAPNKDANLFELGCESKRAYQWVEDHGFTIPKNLFVVGTVNMDESTNQFSRKVLDRAMTIEMTEASFADYGKVGEPSKDDFIGNDWIAKLINRPVRVAQLVKDGEDIKTVHPGLVEVQECLKKTPFAVAFRFANEYALYKIALGEFDKDNVMKCDPLDHAVLMKVLPRIVGEAEDVAEIYCGARDPKDAKNAKEGSLLGILKDETMLSNAKMKEILGRKSTYLTFWP